MFLDMVATLVPAGHCVHVDDEAHEYELVVEHCVGIVPPEHPWLFVPRVFSTEYAPQANPAGHAWHM